MRHSNVAKVVCFVVLNSCVDIRIWVYQERVMVSILDTYQPRIPTIWFESRELTFHSGPTTALRQESRLFLFRKCHDHQTFDEEPITNGLVVSIEQHYGGRTSWA